MKINLITVGNKMPAWIVTGYQEYARRMTPFCQLQTTEIPLTSRGKQSDSQTLQKEAEQILALISPRDYVITLDIKGKLWDTLQLAKELEKWMLQSSYISLIIGGPDGLAPSCNARANQRWSLSPLTFPHPLVRIIVIEQLYRAFSILKHHPYHRE